MHVLLGDNGSGTGTCKATDIISGCEMATQRHLMNCRRYFSKRTPVLEMGPVPCNKPLHQITTDTSLVLPKLWLQTLHYPFITLLFVIYSLFMGSLILFLMGRDFAAGRSTRWCRKTKSSSNPCILNGSRKHFPKDSLPPLPIQMFSSSKVLKKTWRKRRERKKKKIFKIDWLVRS